MEEKNKDKSINSSDSGDKTKIVKTQKRENEIESAKNVNKQDSAENINETDTKLSQKENTIPPINKSNNKNTKNKSVINSNLIGQTVKNRYEIESILGHGGLCDVYLAKDKILESSGSESPYVALKVLQKEFASQPETARMLIREAQQTQRLSHPNVIRVFDFGVDGDIYFLVMEYIDGENVGKFNPTISSKWFEVPCNAFYPQPNPRRTILCSFARRCTRRLKTSQRNFDLRRPCKAFGFWCVENSPDQTGSVCSKT